MPCYGGTFDLRALWRRKTGVERPDDVRTLRRALLQLELEYDEAVRRRTVVQEENARLRYRILHLVRAVRESDARLPKAGPGDGAGSGAA